MLSSTAVTRMFSSAAELIKVGRASRTGSIARGIIITQLHRRLRRRVKISDDQLCAHDLERGTSLQFSIYVPSKSCWPVISTYLTCPYRGIRAVGILPGLWYPDLHQSYPNDYR